MWNSGHIKHQALQVLLILFHHLPDLRPPNYQPLSPSDEHPPCTLLIDDIMCEHLKLTLIIGHGWINVWLFVFIVVWFLVRVWPTLKCIATWTKTSAELRLFRAFNQKTYRSRHQSQSFYTWQIYSPESSLVTPCNCKTEGSPGSTILNIWIVKCNLHSVFCPPKKSQLPSLKNLT